MSCTESSDLVPGTETLDKHVQLNNLREAVEEFTKLIGSAEDSVLLHCTIPTWCTASDTCVDLHDLQTLRTRFLMFIHDLMKALRSHHITANYRLAPSNSSLCLLYCTPSTFDPFQAKAELFGAFHSAEISKRENVVLANLAHGPSLLVT